jgi:hypothetical protein
MIKRWLAKILEECRVIRQNEFAGNMEVQIREQYKEHYRTQIAESEKKGFDEGCRRTHEAYQVEFAKLHRQLQEKQAREWVNDRSMKHGDSIQDANGKVFTLHEQQTSEVTTQKPKRVQRRKQSRASKRV